MIDLHTHTTASDGRCTPPELVARAAAAGIRVLSVTDHDTVAGCAAAAAACTEAGLDFVPGIEVTAVRDDADVHTLGYFIDTSSAAFSAFLSEQRHRRIDRAREMIERLRGFGILLDAAAVLQPALDDPSQSAGRPWLARAMVAAGYVADTNEAFDRYLARGRPAFVPRVAAQPGEVIARIHDAGGIASIAHPGLLRRDDWLPDFVRADLDALEVYHTDHDPPATVRYAALAKKFGLGVTGGSDYHADQSHGAVASGSTSLPREEYDRLMGLADARRRSSSSS